MKTYFFRSIAFVLTTLLIFACKEDSLITEPIVIAGTSSISGTVVFDRNGDGMPDTIVRGSVYYGDFPVDSLSVLNALITKIEEDGHYRFDSLPEADNKVLFLDPSVYEVEGTDNTPDGDPMETETFAYIHVALTAGEEDDGNDFLVQPYQTAITGRVLEDVDGDGLGDVPVVGIGIELWTRAADGQPGFTRWTQLDTDASGNFEILHAAPDAYVLQILQTPDLMSLSGSDTSPDPDGQGDPAFPHLIPVDLEDKEKDADNVFVVRRKMRSTVAGQVLEDIDDDLVGDLPVEGHRVELYFRDPVTGVPTSSTGNPVQAMNSDADGQFIFQDLEPGKYVLYHIGSGAPPLQCVMGSDLSPEPGEPTVHPACFFIQVDILNDTAQDFDNTFVLKKG